MKEEVKIFSMRVAGKTGGNLNFKILKIVPHAKLVTVTQTKHGPWHKADPFKTRLGCVSSQFITSLRFSVTDGSLFYEAICACMLGWVQYARLACGGPWSIWWFQVSQWHRDRKTVGLVCRRVPVLWLSRRSRNPVPALLVPTPS